MSEKDSAPRTAKLSELKTDQNNANLGTQRGLAELDRSLRELGAGRSILLDKQGRVIAGNKTLERAADIGFEDVIVVPTDGTKLVAVQRVDLDLESDPNAKRLAIADNRISELDLQWSPEQLLEYARQDPAITDGLWTDDEWESEILSSIAAGEEELHASEGKTTVLDQAVQLQPAREYAVIMCADEDEWERLKVALDLQPVRRGGYRQDSPFDAIGTERVIHASRLFEILESHSSAPEIDPDAANYEIAVGLNATQFRCRKGTYDARVVAEVQKPSSGYFDWLKLSPSDRVLDIGGHIGSFSIMAATLAEHVVTFEPNPDNFRVLEFNAAHNNITNLTLHNAAVVGNQDTTRHLFLSAGDNTGNHTLKKTRGRDSIPVSCQNINEIIRNHRINKIKMDCETAEIELLQSISEWDSIDSISLEFHISMLGEKGPELYWWAIDLLKSHFPHVKYSEKIQGAWNRLIHARK